MPVTNFQIPEEVSTKKVDNFRGIFTLKPLEKGYGVTIGNALRRVMLSSLEGYAITSIRVPGVQHEFSTIEGVMEDVVEIILNLKQVRFKKIRDNAEDKIFIPISKKKILKAGDITQATSSFEILNPDLVICHVDESARFELEITVEQGRGYLPAEENTPPNPVKGLIPVDAIFTPIKNVKYLVENIRVGQKTDYESLVLEIQTDGTIHPKEALERTANILIEHFNLLSGENKFIEATDEEEPKAVDESMLQTCKLFKTPLEDLALSVRAYNCLKNANIKTLGDLVQLTIEEIAKFKNFGKKSLQELEELVASKGLSFGMNISAYDVEQQNKLADGCSQQG